MIKVEMIDSENAKCVVKGSRMEIGAELMMIFKAVLMRADDEYHKKLLVDWLHMVVNIASKHFDDLKAEVSEPANTDAENYFKSILGGGTDD